MVACKRKDKGSKETKMSYPRELEKILCFYKSIKRNKAMKGKCTTK